LLGVAQEPLQVRAQLLQQVMELQQQPVRALALQLAQALTVV
jgi:hypothetical protein